MEDAVVDGSFDCFERGVLVCFHLFNDLVDKLLFQKQEVPKGGVFKQNSPHRHHQTVFAPSIGEATLMDLLVAAPSILLGLQLNSGLEDWDG